MRGPWHPGLLAVVAAGLAGPLAAQQPRPAERRCRLEVVRVQRQGVRVETAPGIVNLFAGGNVHVRCVGRQVNMFADSVAIFGENVAQFIGKVRYRDSVTAIDADFGQYTKLARDEYFDAQGNVVHRDLASGSTIEGPRILYYPPLEGVRPVAEANADQRPTVKYILEDSAAADQEPYVVVGDRVRMAGGDVLNAWGRVTVDRSDLEARADTLWIDNGKYQAGQLAGNASLRGIGRDSFHLTGGTIDLALADRKLTGLKARRAARLVTSDATLEADSLQLTLADGEVERTAAWGRERRPHLQSEDYEARGDSLVVETPARRLRSLRTYGDGWVGLRPDSTDGRRDWIAGGQVVVAFADRDSAGTTTSAVREILAEGKARTYYRMAAERPGERASINYTRADRIQITMRVTGDSTAVERVTADGNVDGVHLQPALAGADSARADTAARRPPGGGPRP